MNINDNVIITNYIYPFYNFVNKTGTITDIINNDRVNVRVHNTEYALIISKRDLKVIEPNIITELKNLLSELPTFIAFNEKDKFIDLLCLFVSNSYSQERFRLTLMEKLLPTPKSSLTSILYGNYIHRTPIDDKPIITLNQIAKTLHDTTLLFLPSISIRTIISHLQLYRPEVDSIIDYLKENRND